MVCPRFLAILVVAFVPLNAHAQDGWFLFRGNAQRTGAASSLPAWPKRPAWQRPLLMDKVEELADDDDELTKLRINQLSKDTDPTILPGFFPLIVNGTCIYRNHRQVCAVAMEGCELKDNLSGRIEKYKPSDIIWKTIPQSASLAELLKLRRFRTEQLVTLLQASKHEPYLWANPMIGSLSSDGKQVFAINDVVFPKLEVANPGVVLKALLGDLMMLAKYNQAQSYFADTGMLNVEAGSYPFRKGHYDDTYFLGPPIPGNGKEFALNDDGQNLRLLVLNFDLGGPNDLRARAPEKNLQLTKIPAAEQITQSPLRRTQPLHIAEKDGLLVCPTNLGVLFGVDRAKMTVRWEYRYRDAKIAAPAHPHFQAAGPIIARNRIVFTAADAREIHCLDLDGKKQWTAKADNDLYLATVHDDIVLLVGKTQCRGLDLADGKEKWKLATGLPAGVGVLDGSLYYLPLKRDAVTDRPTLWAIDLAKGKKAHRLDMPYPDALGNLALHRGMFVSQSVTHVAAFPLTVKKP